ncbi:MAG TPA: c-type cytochrome [Candidatus Acidoferrales bacterium]|nr:c-type cytochrome [Candidatus Acidoferrales bacterium]
MANCFRPQFLGTLAGIALLVAAVILVPPLHAQEQTKESTPHPLAWAYAVLENPLPPPPPPDDKTPLKVPGSDQAFTMKQIRDTGNPVDWFPGDHPPMPTIVAHRRSPGVNPWIGSCGLCHYPNGKGRPENAGVAGLPEGYILSQLADFKAGARRTADPGKRNTAVMAGNASGITDEEARAAAKYFSSMKMTPWIKVVETETVPKTRNAGGFYVPVEGNEKEPIGQRILEMPVDPDATETYRNPHSGWIAYVPVGSVKKGEDLVLKGGAGKTVACAACHGEDLKGNGNFPPLAGRSPSYIARQLFDIQQYTRNGAGATLMRPIVQNLSEGDILAITAYLASLAP